VLVLRGCGPRGYPGMPEVANLPLPRKLLEAGVRDMVRICDGRMSGTAYGTVVLHVAPEAAAGGPLGLIRTGDVVVLDVAGRRLDVEVTAEKSGSGNAKGEIGYVRTTTSTGTKTNTPYLKTPLAVLVREAGRVSNAGHHDLAAAIETEVDRMRRQVDFHLARARAAASGATPGARSAVLESAEGLARALDRLHDDRGVSLELKVAGEHTVRTERQDLDEMLGNLLDNACKWARTRVVLESTRRNGVIVLTVDDDGPGIDGTLLEAVLQRGVRADEASPGTGFGLAIVRDLAELYGGSIALERMPGGGLRAVLQLPAA